MNGVDGLVIFDDSTAIVNGEVVQRSKERSTVMIYGEYVPLIFDCANGNV